MSLATGSYLQIINSDDWLSENQIETALNKLKDSSCGFAFGDTMYHDMDASPLFSYKACSNYQKVIKKRMPDFNHLTVLARKEMYDTIGNFNIKYKIAMDYDWLLRGYLAGYKGLYVPELMGHMQLCGVSDINYLTSYREVRQISIQHGYPIILAYWFYLSRTFKSFIRRSLELMFPKKLILPLRRMSNVCYDKHGDSS